MPRIDVSNVRRRRRAPFAWAGGRALEGIDCSLRIGIGPALNSTAGCLDCSVAGIVEVGVRASTPTQEDWTIAGRRWLEPAEQKAYE